MLTEAEKEDVRMYLQETRTDRVMKIALAYAIVVIAGSIAFYMITSAGV